jgi:CheY-like chemotaxis protein
MSSLPPDLLAPLERQAHLHQRLTHPARLAELEAFRKQLVTLCGEEPYLSLSLEGYFRGPEDLAEVPLTDYLGTILQVRHSALYVHQADGTFTCLVAFGRTLGAIKPDGVLLPWLMIHGPLVRSQLTLEGLSPEEGARLLEELDVLNAELVIPLTVNDGLWGLLVVGPSLEGTSGACEMLRLSLYGWKLLQAIARHEQGLPTRTQRRVQEQEETVGALQDLWETLRPPQGLKLLLVDEMPTVVKRLHERFQAFGFTVAGCTSEAEAIALLDSFSPQLIILDLSLNRCFPVAVLKAALHHVPTAVILGTTTGHYAEADAADRHAVARELGVQHILRKPVDLAPLAQLVLESALRLTLLPERQPSVS